MYTSKQLIWMCQTGSRSPEVCLSGFNGDAAARLPDPVFTAGRPLPGSAARPAGAVLGDADREDIHRSWRHIVEDYIARTLTHADDKLRAIAGIASRLKAAAPDMTYVAGLWFPLGGRHRHQIASELMWFVPMQERDTVRGDEEPPRCWSTIVLVVIGSAKGGLTDAPCAIPLQNVSVLKKKEMV